MLDFVLRPVHSSSSKPRPQTRVRFASKILPGDLSGHPMVKASAEFVQKTGITVNFTLQNKLAELNQMTHILAGLSRYPDAVLKKLGDKGLHLRFSPLKELHNHEGTYYMPPVRGFPSYVHLTPPYGSANTTVHEFAHAIDRLLSPVSGKNIAEVDPDYRRAFKTDVIQLIGTPAERQSNDIEGTYQKILATMPMDDVFHQDGTPVRKWNNQYGDLTEMRTRLKTHPNMTAWAKTDPRKEEYAWLIKNLIRQFEKLQDNISEPFAELMRFTLMDDNDADFKHRKQMFPQSTTYMNTLLNRLSQTP